MMKTNMAENGISFGICSSKLYVVLMSSQKKNTPSTPILVVVSPEEVQETFETAVATAAQAM
jgi:hypothetical protein